MEGAPVVQLLSFHEQHGQSQAAVRGQVGGISRKGEVFPESSCLGPDSLGSRTLSSTHPGLEFP